MMAAAPAEQARTLELFNLALMLSVGEKELPPALVDYCDRILQQARALVDSPAKAGPVAPEVIQLALDLRDDPNVKQAMDGVISFKFIKPHQAQQALTGLERAVAV